MMRSSDRKQVERAILLTSLERIVHHCLRNMTMRRHSLLSYLILLRPQTAMIQDNSSTKSSVTTKAIDQVKCKATNMKSPRISRVSLVKQFQLCKSTSKDTEPHKKESNRERGPRIHHQIHLKLIGKQYLVKKLWILK